VYFSNYWFNWQIGTSSANKLWEKKMIPSLELDAGMDMHDAFFLTRAIKKLKEKLGKK